MLPLCSVGKLKNAPIQQVQVTVMPEIIKEPERFPEPESRFYEGGRSYKDFFNNREAGFHRSEAWTDEINELEVFFNNNKPPMTIKLNPWSLIADVKSFISAHITTLRAYNGNKYYIGYLQRLNELKAILT